MSDGTPQLPRELARRYSALGVLGRGAMGVVVRARDLSLNRDVALKLLGPQLEEPTAVARFIREARVLASLSHAGVVRLLDADVAGSVVYLAMELIEGETLAEVLAGGRLDPAEATAVLAGILDALAHVHATGLLHRDIKPSNIFLRDSLHPVLIDFGLARLPNGTLLTQPGGVLGTPKYLAPELLRGREHTVATELFSVGLVGLEMLTDAEIHVMPGHRDRFSGVLASLATGAYYPHAARALQPFGALGAAILRALAPDPAERFATAAAMRAALVRRRKKPPEPRAAKPAVRAPLGVALFLALVALASGYRMRQVPPPSPPPPASAPDDAPPATADLPGWVAARARRFDATPEPARAALLDRTIGQLAAVDLPGAVRVAPPTTLSRALAAQLFTEGHAALARSRVEFAGMDRWLDAHMQFEGMSQADRRRAYGLEFARLDPARAAKVRAGLREDVQAGVRRARALLAIGPPPPVEAGCGSMLYGLLSMAHDHDLWPPAEMKLFSARWMTGRPRGIAYHLLRGMEGRLWLSAVERHRELKEALALYERGLAADPASPDADELSQLADLLGEIFDALKRVPSTPGEVDALIGTWRLWSARASHIPAAQRRDGHDLERVAAELKKR